MVLLFGGGSMHAQSINAFEQIVGSKRLITHFIFVCPPGKEGKMYKQAAWALDVKSVLVDGKEMITHSERLTEHPESPRIVTTKAAFFIYAVPIEEGLLRMEPIVSGNSTTETDVIRWPPVWDVIEVTYKVRYPSGEVSEALKTRVRRVPSE